MIDEDLNIIGIVQARMGSTRLPNKVLMQVKGKPLLQHMVERLATSKYLSKTVIATTTEPGDDVIEFFATQNGYPVFRGSESDVLDRFYQTATYYKSDIIVRFCSDCPLIDPSLVDKIIEIFLQHQERIALVGNKMPFTFPDGYDVEVCSIRTLERIWKEANQKTDREHVFTYLYRNPELFPILNVEYEGGDLFHTHRFTLDYEEDFDCIRKVIENLCDHNPAFGLSEVIKLAKADPSILEINSMHLPGEAVRFAIDAGHSPKDNRIKIK
jgi:spore coat polysaccharide biosynthesis protein SpsF (cytidylyltransferase family)